MRTDPETRRLALEALGESPGLLEYGRVSKRMGVPETTLRTWMHRHRKATGQLETRVATKIETKPETKPPQRAKRGKAGAGEEKQSGFRGAERQEVTKETIDPRVTPRQAEAAGMLVAGRRWREVQEAMGMSSGTLTLWHREPGFTSYLRELRELNTLAVQTAMAAIGPAAVDAVRETVDGGSDIPPATRLTAAFGTLDRMGVGPKSSISMEVSTPPPPPIDLTTPEGEEAIVQAAAQLPLDLLRRAMERASGRKLRLDPWVVEVEVEP